MKQYSIKNGLNISSCIIFMFINRENMNEAIFSSTVIFKFLSIKL